MRSSGSDAPRLVVGRCLVADNRGAPPDHVRRGPLPTDDTAVRVYSGWAQGDGASSHACRPDIRWRIWPGVG